MTIVVSERRQHLELADEWDVLKWDDCEEFRGGVQRADVGVKAADIVAARMARRGAASLLVCEFKDFEHPDIPSEQRAGVALQALSDDLADALVRKVIDTLSGATFSHDKHDQRCHALSTWRAAAAEDSDVLVLFCIEVPRSQALAVLAWTAKLKRRLRWLGPRALVLVTSSARPFSSADISYRV
jgi:hypothetical protein